MPDLRLENMNFRHKGIILNLCQKYLLQVDLLETPAKSNIYIAQTQRAKVTSRLQISTKTWDHFLVRKNFWFKTFKTHQLSNHWFQITKVDITSVHIWREINFWSSSIDFLPINVRILTLAVNLEHYLDLQLIFDCLIFIEFWHRAQTERLAGMTKHQLECIRQPASASHNHIPDILRLGGGTGDCQSEDKLKTDSQ